MSLRLRRGMWVRLVEDVTTRNGTLIGRQGDYAIVAISSVSGWDFGAIILPDAITSRVIRGLNMEQVELLEKPPYLDAASFTTIKTLMDMSELRIAP